MNKSFEKVSDSTPKISGYQKACILLSEIGSENNLLRQQIVDLLKLSPKEVKKMNHAFKTLGVFNTKNKKVVLRENIVLQEAIDYGVKKRLFYTGGTSWTCRRHFKNPRNGKSESEFNCTADRNLAR